MASDLSVNGGSGAGGGGSLHGLKDELNRLISANAPPQNGAEDQGPCLYLGEAGQRCDRRAVEGGFCRAHQGQRDHLNVDVDGDGPVKTSARAATPTKVLAASIGIIGILLPYIFDLVREVLRWVNSH